MIRKLHLKDDGVNGIKKSGEIGSKGRGGNRRVIFSLMN